MKTFILFGPTHAGKSTLAGYLLTKHMSDIEFMLADNAHRQEIEEEGHRYHSDMRLAYFFDEAKDEHKRFSDSNSRGNTKLPHIKKISLFGDMSNLQIIDSLGSDRNEKWMLRTLLMADVAVYVIDIRDVVKLTNMIDGESDKVYEAWYNRIFAPLFAWCDIQRKGIGSLIIVFSQIDTINFNRIEIQNAIDRVREESQLFNVPICPISINVNNRKSYHVCEDSEQTDWFSYTPFKGQTLITILNRYLNQSESISGSFFGYIDTKKKPAFLGKEVIRFRVLRGSISMNDTVLLGPVDDRQNKPFFLKGKVKTLRHESCDTNAITFETGSIGGVLLDSLSKYDMISQKHSENITDLRDIKLTRPSMIFSTNFKSVTIGNLLIFKIKLDLENNSTLLSKINLNRDIPLVWFGKFIPVRVVGFHYIEKNIYCTLLKKQLSSDDVFVVPLDEEGNFPFLHHKFALRIDDKTLIPVNLKKVMSVDQETGFELRMLITSTLTCGKDKILSFFPNRENQWNILNNDSDNYEITCKNVTSRNVNSVLVLLRDFLADFGISNREIYVTFPNAIDRTQGVF